MSVKAVLVILWAFLIAGAAVASENHRLCVLDEHAKLQQIHEAHRHQEEPLLAGTGLDELWVVARVTTGTAPVRAVLQFTEVR